ncbi:MAG: excinuclease ABC subunit UvrC [Polyangiaceae bacterium]
MSSVTEKLESLPVSPGVYLFKDKTGVVVYVGKAKSLRSRVRSYFQEGTGDSRYFIPILRKVLGDLDTIVTNTEKEAAILENTLIKEHQPKFNVKLRDDKNFLSIRLQPRDAWARLHLVRKIAADGARYFGPYHSATSARRTLAVVNKHFQLRTCTDAEMRARRRPCLQYQIKRCPAPCVYEVDPGYYAEQVANVAMFLDGKHDELSALLDERMRKAAREMQFELAAVHRDQLRAIEKVREAQKVVSTDLSDRDVIGLYRSADLAEIAVLQVRGGRLGDVATFALSGVAPLDEDVLSAFVAEYYALYKEDEERRPIPPEILVSADIEADIGMAELLSERAKRKVSLRLPQRGRKTELLSLAVDNAKHAFEERRRSKLDVDERLEQIRERLRLPLRPVRIECCDISHLGGADAVGAVVAMKNGELDKSRYRSYTVRGAAAQGGRGGDDYAAMYEVLARRFRRGRTNADPSPKEDASEGPVAKDESLDVSPEPSRENEWELPDLFVVDGGRGQLAVAQTAARDLGLFDLCIVGLAKERDVNAKGEEVVDRVYLPGQKNPVPVRSYAGLLLLARLRDEAHRFANRARERLGKGRRFESKLDHIAGIGPQTKKQLFMQFRTLDAIAGASDVELLAIRGMTKPRLAALRLALGEPATKVADEETMLMPAAPPEHEEEQK